mmetsp:Transcript_30609/g.94649  ORF Transcript_30609/g.94649 Transcript_30609/m.94649 type:complete len:329 (+) Transcript_30609:121-1107(+)
MKPTSLLPLLALAAANAFNYKGDDAWPALQKAIADYPKFHASELEKIKKGDTSARFLILTAYHGLGNRERSMMSGFAFALANRLALFIDFPTAECDALADRKHVACNPAELHNMYKEPPFHWTAVSKCRDRSKINGMHDVCIGKTRVRGGNVINLQDDTEEEVIRRGGVHKIGPRVLMHSDHTMLKYVVCDNGVRKTGLFPPDFFAAQRQIEAFLLRPSKDVRERADTALKAAGGCAVGLHLRGKEDHHERVDIILDDLEPALAAAPGGLFVLGDGNNEQKKERHRQAGAPARDERRRRRRQRPEGRTHVGARREPRPLVVRDARANE